MAAGDIILSNGTTITPEDLQKIAAAVEDLIAATAKDPGQYEEVTTLTGVTSLPVFLQLGAVYKLVRVAVSILKGVDGREVHLQVNQDKTYIQWRYTDGNWQNLVALADLKGAPGDTPVFRTGSTGIEWKYQSEADTAYRTLISIDVLKLKFSDLTPEQKDELALHFKDLTEEEKAELMKPATDAAAIANKAAEDADAATALAVQATANAKSVSDHPGYIGSDYHVYTWDYTTGSYNKTDTVLRPEGFSIYRSYSSIDAMNADLANVPEGKFVLINTNDVEQADNAKLYVRGATSFEYLVDMSGAIGFTGKTPQITIGTVTVGATASATLSPDGTDDDGNPKYKLNLVIVAGPQGLTPVIESGETTTGQPGTDASAELVPSGQTEDGRDKYLLNLTIPRGNPGEGTGNVFVEPSGLESGKKYLFMPSTNGSTEGAFVEYVEPDIPEQVQPDWNATEGKGAILNKPDIPTKTSELENDDHTVKDENYVHTDNNFTNPEKDKLNKLNFVPTLDHEPGESDISFSSADGIHSFLIGDFVRVADTESDQGYVFYQLYDIKDNKAVWAKAGTGGGGIVSLTEKVNITITSNQAQPDLSLNGLIVHVKYGDNDTQLTWDGTAMSAEIPMNMTYTIEYPTLEGYSTPENEEYIALAGNTRNIEASYNTTVLTINVDSNQADKGDLENVHIILSGSISKTIDYEGQPLVVKVPTGLEVTITPSQINGYASVDPAIITPTTSTDSISFLYNTELLTVTLVADNGVSCSGQKVTIGGTEYTYSDPIVRKIPYGTSYSISVDDKNGFTSPSSVGPLTANQVSREVTMTYQEIKVNTIHIDQTIYDTETMISGDINGDIIQWIRQNSHRVLAKKTSEGHVTYCRLKDDGGSLYYDGSTANLRGGEGDVFMKPPRFFYKGTEGDQVDISFAKERIDDSYIEWDGNILIGVYEGYASGEKKAYSHSGVASTGSISQENWKQYARNRGEGYQIVDWQMHCVMGCLYYAMYGNTNCQAEIGAGTNSYSKNTGGTDALGMEDTKASTNGNNQSINFWGLENWWGNKYEWIDDYVNPANTLTATVNDPVNGGTRNLSIPPSGYTGYYVKKMKFGRYCDLVATNDDPKNGTDSTGYADYQWWPNSTSSSSRVVRRSYYNSGADGGVAFAHASYASSSTYANYGSRLAFRGVATEAESVATFKSLPVL